MMFFVKFVIFSIIFLQKIEELSFLSKTSMKSVYHVDVKITLRWSLIGLGLKYLYKILQLFWF